MKMPLGIKILLPLAALSVVLSFIEVLQGKYLAASRYGLIVPDNIEILITLGFFIADAAWVAGMVKRLSWSWKLFLGVTLTEALLGVIGLNNNTQTDNKIYTGIFLVITALAAFYVYINRNYFNRKS